MEQPKKNFASLKPLPAKFYLQHTVEVARGLIGAYLARSAERGELLGRIVETEAYREDDPASHSFRGRTRRTIPMFAAGGIAYVYFIYGMYDCFNVVTEPDGTGCAVLVRAVEPVHNTELMWANRFPELRYDPEKIHSIASGPGKLSRAMAITRELNGVSLSNGPLRVLKGTDDPPPVVSSSPRIGVKNGTELLWRFFDAKSKSVSR